MKIGQLVRIKDYAGHGTICEILDIAVNDIMKSYVLRCRVHESNTVWSMAFHVGQIIFLNSWQVIVL